MKNVLIILLMIFPYKSLGQGIQSFDLYAVNFNLLCFRYSLDYSDVIEMCEQGSENTIWYKIDSSSKYFSKLKNKLTSIKHDSTNVKYLLDLRLVLVIRYLNHSDLIGFESNGNMKFNNLKCKDNPDLFQELIKLLPRQYRRISK